MKKLLLLAVCIAMAYGCSQSDLLTEPGLIQSSTKSVQRVAGLLQINAGGGTVQAHVSLNPAIPLYLDVYITVHNINIDFGGGSGTTYGSATLITGGGGDGCDTLCLVVTSPYFHIPANNGKI